MRKAICAIVLWNTISINIAFASDESCPFGVCLGGTDTQPTPVATPAATPVATPSPSPAPSSQSGGGGGGGAGALAGLAGLAGLLGKGKTSEEIREREEEDFNGQTHMSNLSPTGFFDPRGGRKLSKAAETHVQPQPARAAPAKSRLNGADF